MAELVMHNYKFGYNDRGYINSFMAVLEGDWDWYGQASTIEHGLASGCYKFINGELIFDQEEYDIIQAEKAKLARIAELKQKLTETDYIYNSIREGGRPEEYYAEVIEQRKAWRKEIQDLETELGI